MPDRAIGLAVGLGLLLHLAAVLSTDLSPDEAYYAAWSEHLAAAYPEHPPAVAWVIAAARSVAGGTLGVRLPALLAAFVVPLLLASAARRLADERAARRVAWLATGTLLLHVLGVIVTPDTPLTVAWAGGLWALASLHERAARGAPLGVPLVAAGLAAGAALLSKLTGWVLLAGLLAAILWHPGLRRRVGPRAAVVPAVALLVALPWLLASVTAERSDVAFQLARAGARWRFGVGLPAYLGAQLGLLTPVLAAAAVRWMVRAGRRRGEVDRLLLPTVVPLVGGLLLLSVLRPVEANWPGPAWLGAILGLGLEPLGSRWRGALLATCVPLVVLLHIVAAARLGVDARADPTARIHGWKALGRALEPDCEASGGPPRLVAEGYGLAAEVHHYAPACRPVRVLPGGRPTAFDRWDPPAFPRAGAVAVLSRCRRPLVLPPGCEVLRERRAVHPLACLELWSCAAGAGR